MNSREQNVKQKYEEQGWHVLRGGAPDFLAIRVDTEGNILEFKGVEVKSESANLTYEQAVYRKLFALAGIPHVVEVVPAHANPDHSTPHHARPVHPTPCHTNPPLFKPHQASPLQARPHQARPGHPRPSQTTSNQINGGLSEKIT
jgi:hypothetical protein